MKIPALRAKIGDWEYYITTLTFEQVTEYVVPIDENLYKSEGLKDILQRSLTDNYVSIKNYIVNQPELFFNSLVLAVYDDYPEWREIEVKYNENEFYKLGVLEFPGNHKIFPVDGQHRVEGIKAAIRENESLKSQEIGAIFIGHKNTDEGKKKTRRLFTTLNRYAKPVSLDDIIALDEDDCVAIITRYLLEEYDLFTDKRVVYAKQKAIPNTNKNAITSIITLYQANVEIFKLFYINATQKKPTTKNISEYLKLRPTDDNLEAFKDFSISFWDAFKDKLDDIKAYLTKEENASAEYRNSDNGGSLIFRPVGILPLVKAAIEIQKRNNSSFPEIFEKLNTLNLYMNNKPWTNVLWNNVEKKMITGSDTVVFWMLIYLYDKELLAANELQTLKKGYAAKISVEGNEVNTVLDEI